MIQREPLRPGDTIEFSVTHEIRINGDKSWVGSRVNSTIREDETTEDAETRVMTQVNEAVMRAVQTTVKAVEEAG